MVDLQGVADRLAAVDGVLGVCLGGSRARGAHGPGSDYDLGLYYRGPLDTGGLRALAAELTGRPVEVSEPGGWGPWVDGGAWLRLDDAPMDWIYRDLDRVRGTWQDCEQGRFELAAQIGHPFGFASFCYPGELALGVLLADPSGELTELQAAVRSYPVALREAVLERARFEVPFSLATARKGADRGDTTYLHGCLFRAVLLLAHALHARAGRWLLNEKGAVREAAELPGAPADFAARAHGLFGLPPAAALAGAERLAAEVL
ncbi:nucleotidyltransferase domain-containing protein [Kitasatospora sp. NPDC002040]|uniref:nucleotidyltransferase domain-containing protein n=1 Tax=Kitasatospora sp. NPDC002040 TaxID=3154661 RepID=UPI00331FE0D9